MRCFVVVAGALVPAVWSSEVLREARAPSLRRLVRRATIGGTEPVPAALANAGHWHWLWRSFGGATEQPVTAPYAWRALKADAASDGSQVWFADPVHFAFARDHMLVRPLGAAAVDADEARELARAAATALQDAGARLALVGAHHWFLLCDRPWHLDTTPLDAALGHSVQDTWPVGIDAPRWRRLLTEIQIAWHHEAVNARRESSGQIAVNGVWLHGGGTWQSLPASPFAFLLSDCPVTRGWMLAAGRPPSALLPMDAPLPPGGDAVLSWSGLQAPACLTDWGLWLQQLEAFDDWLPGFVRRAFGCGCTALELVLTGGQHLRRITLHRDDRWRLWRRADLPAVLSAPAGTGASVPAAPGRGHAGAAQHASGIDR
jgi:hypothetical protein